MQASGASVFILCLGFLCIYFHVYMTCIFTYIYIYIYIFIYIYIYITKPLRFQPNVCNRYHDWLMMPINLGNIAILNIKGSDYCCIISLINKNKAINLLQNADLTLKSGKLWIKKIWKFLGAIKWKFLLLMVLKFKNKNFTNIKSLFH